MKFRIIETQELKDLTIIGINGIEWTQDLIGNTEGLDYNNDTEEYEMSQDGYAWWKWYITDNEKDAKEIKEFCEENNIDEADFWGRYNDEIINDLEEEHNLKQNLLEELREWLKEEKIEGQELKNLGLSEEALNIYSNSSWAIYTKGNKFNVYINGDICATCDDIIELYDFLKEMTME